MSVLKAARAQVARGACDQPGGHQVRYENWGSGALQLGLPFGATL